MVPLDNWSWSVNLQLLAELVSAIASLASLIVSIYFGLKSRTAPELSYALDMLYRFSGLESIPQAGAALPDRLQVLFEGEPVRSLYVLRAHLFNSGNVPITSQDVLSPVEFTFSQDATLLSCLVERSTPEQPEVHLATQPNAAQLEFDVLEPGCDVPMLFTYTGSESKPVVTARIEGIRALREISSDQEPKWPHALESSALAAQSAFAWAMCGLLVHYLGWPVMVGFVSAALLGITARRWASLLATMRASGTVPRRTA